MLQPENKGILPSTTHMCVAEPHNAYGQETDISLPESKRQIRLTQITDPMIVMSSSTPPTSISAIPAETC